MAKIRDENNTNADRLDKESLRESEPVRLDEILPSVMADIEKRMNKLCCAELSQRNLL
jgi:hypothetical protein